MATAALAMNNQTRLLAAGLLLAAAARHAEESTIAEVRRGVVLNVRGSARRWQRRADTMVTVVVVALGVAGLAHSVLKEQGARRPDRTGGGVAGSAAG